MAKECDGNHAMDIGHFDRIEGRSVGKRVAVFHSSAYPPPPGGPQVKLTTEELDARISWRKNAKLEVEEEEKAKAELDR